MYEALSGLAFLTVAILATRGVVAVVRAHQRTCLLCGQPLRIRGILGWLEPPIHNPATLPHCRPLTPSD